MIEQISVRKGLYKRKGKVDTTLFIKRKLHDIILGQIYVDDIIFGSPNDSLCKEFSQDMKNEFEMSMMGKLNVPLLLVSMR